MSLVRKSQNILFKRIRPTLKMRKLGNTEMHLNKNLK